MIYDSRLTMSKIAERGRPARVLLAEFLNPQASRLRSK